MKLTFPIVLLAFGAILGLIALIGKLPTPWGQLGISNHRMRWIAGATGFVVVLLAVYLEGASQFLDQTVSRRLEAESNTSPARVSIESPMVDPEKLIAVIAKLQRDNVSDSAGLMAYQCFTDDALTEFKKANIPDQVAEDLKHDAEFLSLVLTIKAMSPPNRQKLLSRASGTYRRTWAQLGLNPALASQDELRRGQTAAGSEAERLIAEAIVDLVKLLCSTSESNLRKLFP